MSVTSPNGTASMPPGSRLGRWVVQESVGMGGTASVYRAVASTEEPPSEVALRVCRPTNPDHLAAIVSTYRSSPIHPNVMAVYEVFEQELGGVVHVICATELATGSTLQRRLESSPMSEPECRHLAQNLVDGLDAFHRRGLVHGDIKPSNVMWFGDRWKLVDPSATESVPSAPETSAVVSYERTLSYVPPELLDTPGKTRRTGDVWALGVTIYEAVAGTNPFPSFTDQVLFNVDTTVVASPDLKSLIERCLTPIDHRAKTAGELRSTIPTTVMEQAPLRAEKTLVQPPLEAGHDIDRSGAVSASNEPAADIRRRWWPVGIVAAISLSGFLLIDRNGPNDADISQPNTATATTPTTELDASTTTQNQDEPESLPADDSIQAQTIQLDFEDEGQLASLTNLAAPEENAATTVEGGDSKVLSIQSINVTRPYLLKGADGELVSAGGQVSIAADIRMAYHLGDEFEPVGSTSGFVLKAFPDTSVDQPVLPNGYEVMLAPGADGISLWIGAGRELSSGFESYRLLGVDDGHTEAQQWLVKPIDFTDATERLYLGFWRLEASLTAEPTGGEAQRVIINAVLTSPDGERFEYTWTDSGPAAFTGAGAVGINNYGYFSIENQYDNLEIVIE